MPNMLVYSHTIHICLWKKLASKRRTIVKETQFQKRICLLWFEFDRSMKPLLAHRFLKLRSFYLLHSALFTVYKAIAFHFSGRKKNYTALKWSLLRLRYCFHPQPISTWNQRAENAIHNSFLVFFFYPHFLQSQQWIMCLRCLLSSGKC